jgi:lysophospholipase L1-like esterase
MKLENRIPPLALAGSQPPKLKNDFRVIALGDSFTFGPEMHQNDTYAARMERILNQFDKNHKFSVLNFGVRGYSTVQEFQLLKKTYKSVKPDLVLLQITLNDPELVPYRVTQQYLDKNGRVRLTNPVFNYWHSLKLVIEKIVNMKTHSHYLEYYSELFNNPTTFNRFKDAIHQTKTLLSHNNIALAVVVFPLFSHALDKSYPFLEHHKKIRALLQAEQIPFLDLLDRFEGLEPSRLQVLPGIDSHPNEIAHRIAGDALAKWLIRRHIVPISFKGANPADHKESKLTVASGVSR